MDGVIDTFTLTGCVIGLKTFPDKVDNPAIFPPILRVLRASA